jgi:hypothetical protein
MRKKKSMVDNRFSIDQSATISFLVYERKKKNDVSREKKSETDIVKWSRKWI